MRGLPNGRETCKLVNYQQRSCDLELRNEEELSSELHSIARKSRIFEEFTMRPASGRTKVTPLFGLFPGASPTALKNGANPGKSTLAARNLAAFEAASAGGASADVASAQSGPVPRASPSVTSPTPAVQSEGTPEHDGVAGESQEVELDSAPPAEPAKPCPTSTLPAAEASPGSSVPEEVETDVSDAFSNMSIKELKTHLKELGVKYEDCFEKADLIAKARLTASHRQKKPKAPSTASPEASRPAANADDGGKEVEFLKDDDGVRRGRSKKDLKCMVYAPPLVPRSKAQATICQRCFYSNKEHVDLDDKEEVHRHYFNS
ncbi:hypothetical protein CYMTET_56252 [Cymbomonas tetramitiformis]|uniref:T4 recombination endonuclease VII dimerisation domain-containing protein n=1 Tax=Cymbomonas tetramitiformis TaxID=36881 RepID=A0AAE0BCH8_9CHLO|nr:hypothetical protein CYMTET_56252 [Cymbomonas tetramitiformis]